MADTLQLDTPVLLMAMPQVLDPFFHRSVVLLVHHQDEGSAGFIVNRPTQMPIADILGDLELPWEGNGSQAAYFGGPVDAQHGTVIYRMDAADKLVSHDGQELLPGIGMTRHAGDLAQLAALPEHAYRLLLGYAGWGDGQLAEELLRNDWITAPVTTELIFGEDPESVWPLALASVGIDPVQLPTLTGNGGHDAAN